MNFEFFFNNIIFFLYYTQNLKPNIPEIVFPKKSLKFITYNIWFEDFNFDNRAEELCNIMQKSNADYICLQVKLYRYKAQKNLTS